jgi:hypothetical protein
MRIVRTITLAAALGALTATAWAAAQEKPKQINACELLSAEEVAKVIGQAVDPSDRRDSGYVKEGMYSSTCLWRVTADKGKSDPTKPMGGASFAILNAQSWPADKDPSEFLESFRHAAKEGIIPAPPVELKGIGEEAIWWGDGVAVKKGSMSFGVSVFLPNDREKNRPLAEQLAKMVEPRI